VRQGSLFLVASKPDAPIPWPLPPGQNPTGEGEMIRKMDAVGKKTANSIHFSVIPPEERLSEFEETTPAFF
jgi:hypothetical protein